MALTEAVSPGLDVLVKVILDATLKVEIPDPSDADLPPEMLASLVAKTSNAYSSAARAAGMARAEAKLAKGRYERKYKQSRQEGKNDFEREATAMMAAATEHDQWVSAEAVAEIADGVENAARVASESARKLLDKVEHYRFADARAERASQSI